MKRKRRLFAVLLSAMFVAYFSASFIFVPKAPGLKDQDTTIVKLESNDDHVARGHYRSATESTEETINFLNFYTISFIQDFHTIEHQNLLFISLQNARFMADDIYLSIRRLQI